MIPAEIIEKKRDGYELTTQEIKWFIEGVIKNKIDENLSKKTHFYWMSGSAFEYAIEEFPVILEKFHSCGPGNTYEIIKKNVTEDHIKIFLNYEDWKNEITNGKS